MGPNPLFKRCKLRYANDWGTGSRFWVPDNKAKQWRAGSHGRRGPRQRRALMPPITWKRRPTVCGGATGSHVRMNGGLSLLTKFFTRAALMTVLALASLVAVSVGGAYARTDAARPNIVLIMTDDEDVAIH